MTERDYMVCDFYLRCDGARNLYDFQRKKPPPRFWEVYNLRTGLVVGWQDACVEGKGHRKAKHICNPCALKLMGVLDELEIRYESVEPSREIYSDLGRIRVYG